MTDMAVRKESLRTKISQSKIINRFNNYLLIDEVFANVMIYVPNENARIFRKDR